MKPRADDLERRICIDHPHPHLQETLLGTFLGIENRRLGYFHFARCLRSGLLSLHSVALGKSGKLPLGKQFAFGHEGFLAE